MTTNMGDMTAPRSVNLRSWVDERRAELGMKWAELAKECGVTTQALRKNLASGSMRTMTRVAMEDTLRWQRGSIDAIINGGSPTPLPERNESRSELDEKLAWMDREIDRMERQRDELLRQRDTR